MERWRRGPREELRADDFDDPGFDRIRDLSLDSPGVDEEVVVPWPLMMADRLRGRVERSSRSAWIVTWVVLFGTFATAMSITILAVSRNVIAADLGASASDLVWVISGPMVATAILGATAGKIGDLRGHRRVYLLGMSGAAVFSLLCALSWSAPSLIAFRVLGAAVGAATGPASMATINLLFPKHKRSTALGYWSLVVAGGPVVGLIVGGPIVDALGWRWIFLLQGPLLAGAAAVAFVVLPETQRRTDVRFDVPGQISLGVALATGLLAIDRGVAWGWTSASIRALGAVSVSALVAFVVIERRSRSPLVPLHYFGRRRFVAAVAVAFFLQFGYMGGFVLAPQFLQLVGGFSVTTTTWLMIPRPLTFAIAGPVSGPYVPRVGTRAYAVFGAACMVVSLLLMASIAETASAWIAVVSIAISGLGMGSAQPAIASSVANAVSDHDLGVAGAVQQLMAQVGSSLGMNLLNTIQTAAAEPGVSAGFGPAFVVGAAVSVVGLLVATLLPGRSPSAAGDSVRS